jgi:tRNA(adenine34) deaminase
MFSDEYWMEQALKLADQAASEGEVPVGAVLVLDNEIIGQGYNSPISCCDPTAHAEIKAIRDACQKQANYRLPRASLYVTLEPCSMCAGAIVHARIERVIYAATEPKSGVVESQNSFFEQDFLNHSVKVESGVLGALASQKMSDFFQFRREQKKRIRTASKLALEQKKSS